MALTLTQRPATATNWGMVKNPLVYKFARKDGTYSSVADNGTGFAKFRFTGINLTAVFPAGSQIMIYGGVYSGLATVSLSTYSGNTDVTTNLPFTATDTGYCNSLTSFPGYRVEIKVFKGYLDLLVPEAVTYAPLIDGSLIVDVSALVKSKLRPTNDNPMNVGAYLDSGMYKNFFITAQAFWTGGSSSIISDLGNEKNGMLGAIQIPATLGNDLGGYVALSVLTRFTNLKMWNNYPFILSVIATGYLKVVVKGYTAQGSFVNSVTYTDAAALGLYQISVSALWLSTYATYPDYFIVEFRNSVVTPPDYQVRVDVMDTCTDNSIMLMARNSLGGVMQWMFEFTQEELIDYKNYRTKKLTCYTERISQNEWDCLHDFANSNANYREPIVELLAGTIRTDGTIDQQVYIVGTNSSKLGVVTLPPRNRTETRREFNSFQIEVVLPEFF